MRENQPQNPNFSQKIGSFLCRLGFHDFELDLSDHEGRIFGYTIRRCSRCGKRQVADNQWRDL